MCNDVINYVQSVSDETQSNAGAVLCSSPHLNEYAYSHNKSNYSTPVPLHWSGSFAVPQPASNSISIPEATVTVLENTSRTLMGFSDFPTSVLSGRQPATSCFC